MSACVRARMCVEKGSFLTKILLDSSTRSPGKRGHLAVATRPASVMGKQGSNSAAEQKLGPPILTNVLLMVILHALKPG